jgi:hypothetical protein
MFAPRRIAWAILLACLLGAGAVLLWPRPSEPRTAQALAPAKPRPAPAPAPSAVPSKAAEPAPYVIKRVLDVGGPIPFGKWFWDEEGVPDGEVVITIDTAAETLSVFRGGYEIGATAVIYGADDKPTPLGVYPITEKDADHVSNLYGSPMPYMLRMTNDGISIHGSEVSAEFATHGCIGVPKDFARKLFAAVKLGDKVIVTRGERLALGGAVAAARK